jgi:hypothetical protein
MQNMGVAQDHRWPTRLLRLSTAAQARGCALGLLYFAACTALVASDCGAFWLLLARVVWLVGLEEAFHFSGPPPA